MKYKFLASFVFIFAFFFVFSFKHVYADAPQISIPSWDNALEDVAYTPQCSFVDTDSTSWTGTVDYGDGGGTQPLTINGNTCVLNHTYTTAGQQYQLTIYITDDQGVTGTASETVKVYDPGTNIGNITLSPNPITINVTAQVGLLDLLD